MLDFLQAAVDRGDEALVLAFFAGKLSVDDAATVRGLIDDGLVAPPEFLPAWWLRRDRLPALLARWPG